ncbi:MAG: MauE/DoxX family redox-associated membrane protein [Pseudomonadota bacterium]
MSFPESIDLVIRYSIQLCLALVFAWGLGHKLRQPRLFFAQLDAYKLLPSALAPATGVLLIVAEALSVLVLLTNTSTLLALPIALLSLYTGAISFNLARGLRDIDCGCGGDNDSQSLNAWLVVRNLILIAMAGLLLLPANFRDLLWTDILSIAAASICFMILYPTANQLSATADRRRLQRA